MKSKRKQYLLLALVLVVWGLIIYRFFNFTGQQQAAIDPIRTSGTLEEGMEERSRYVYRLNYPDPFLKGSSSFDQPRSPAPQPSRNSHRVSIPSIVFLGVVSSSDTRTGLLKVSGRSYMVRKGDELQGFTILELSDEEIRVRHIEADSVFSLTPNQHPASDAFAGHSSTRGGARQAFESARKR